jgi:hypothetical protein
MTKKAGPFHSSRRCYRAHRVDRRGPLAPRATKTAAERLNHVDVALEEAARRGKTQRRTVGDRGAVYAGILDPQFFLILASQPITAQTRGTKPYVAPQQKL